MTIKRVLHCFRAKAISIIYSEYVSVALVIQHETRMRCVILSSVTCLVLPGFSALSHKLHDFRIKHLLNIKSAIRFSLKLLSETFLFLRIIRRETIIYVNISSCNIPLYTCRILIKFAFSRYILEKYSNIKISLKFSSGSRVVPSGQREEQTVRCTQKWIYEYINSELHRYVYRQAASRVTARGKVVVCTWKDRKIQTVKQYRRVDGRTDRQTDR